MSDFTIRTVRISDAAALSDIYRYYVENTAVSYEYIAPDADEFKRRIAATIEKYPYILAEDEDGILGYAYAGPFNTRTAANWSAEVSIYVSRSKRTRGIGRALYAKLEEILQKQNFQTLLAKVACCERENDEYLTEDSIKFHLACGYEDAGTVKNCGYKFGQWYGLKMMEKYIGSYPSPVPEIIPFSKLDKDPEDI